MVDVTSAVKLDGRLQGNLLLEVLSGEGLSELGRSLQKVDRASAPLLPSFLPTTTTTTYTVQVVHVSAVMLVVVEGWRRDIEGGRQLASACNVCTEALTHDLLRNSGLQSLLNETNQP